MWCSIPLVDAGRSPAAAQKLDRRWLGIDITHLAVGLLKHRLADTTDPTIANPDRVVGEPTDISGARKLAESDPFQLQAWALGLIGARAASQCQEGW